MKAIALLVLLASAMTPFALASTTPAPESLPCRVVRKHSPIYPLRMLEQGITRGEATVLLEVDSTGRVTDQLVTSYTHSEFAREAVRAVKEWTFVPGRNKGESVVCVFNVNFDFQVDGIAMYERSLDTIRTDDYDQNKFTYFAHGSATLDRTPVPVSSDSPIYPESWMKNGRHGSVTVRFFIDEQGRTRIPLIVGGTDEFLASAAVAAVKKWRFQPPLAGGKPVLAQAEQVFTFQPRTVATK